MSRLSECGMPNAAFRSCRCALGVALAVIAGCVRPDTWPPITDYGSRITDFNQQSAIGNRQSPEAPGGPSPAAGVLELDLATSVLIALENNPALKVQRLNPLIRQTREAEERAAFDPVLSARGSAGVERGRISRSWTGAAGAALSQFLPTGTILALEAAWGFADSDTGPKSDTAHLGLSVTQALLQGRGVAVNLASLRQARLDTLASSYELRGFAENLVADVEKAYWDYALAQRQIEIFEGSLKLAEQQEAETAERIRVEKLAEIELAAARAEVAQRRVDLINARGQLAIARLVLLRLLNPQGPALWNREVSLKAQPTVPEDALEPVEAHVQLALRARPDLNEARIQVLRGDLELVKTRNGLLPKLDLFANLGKSGYAQSLGHSVPDIGGRGYDAEVGLVYQFPLGNRAARARHERATLSRQQLDEALTNLAQLAQLDVRSAHIAVATFREQVAATAAARASREETLRAETEKFRVGKSTTLLVAQAQRDLVESQIAEVRAVVNLRKGLVDLYRNDGSLLERRGIAAPGRDTVSLGAADPAFPPPAR